MPILTVSNPNNAQAGLLSNQVLSNASVVNNLLDASIGVSERIASQQLAQEQSLISETGRIAELNFAKDREQQRVREARLNFNRQVTRDNNASLFSDRAADLADDKFTELKDVNDFDQRERTARLGLEVRSNNLSDERNRLARDQEALELGILEETSGAKTEAIQNDLLLKAANAETALGNLEKDEANKDFVDDLKRTEATLKAEDAKLKLQATGQKIKESGQVSELFDGFSGEVYGTTETSDKDFADFKKRVSASKIPSEQKEELIEAMGQTNKSQRKFGLYKTLTKRVKAVKKTKDKNEVYHILKALAFDNNQGADTLRKELWLATKDPSEREGANDLYKKAADLARNDAKKARDEAKKAGAAKKPDTQTDPPPALPSSFTTDGNSTSPPVTGGNSTSPPVTGGNSTSPPVPGRTSTGVPPGANPTALEQEVVKAIGNVEDPDFMSEITEGLRNAVAIGEGDLDQVPTSLKMTHNIGTFFALLGEGASSSGIGKPRDFGDVVKDRAFGQGPDIADTVVLSLATKVSDRLIKEKGGAAKLKPREIQNLRHKVSTLFEQIVKSRTRSREDVEAKSATKAMGAMRAKRRAARLNTQFLPTQ